MRNLPSDMLALAQEIPPPEEWIVACLKMPSGDVWLSDRPVSAALLALLPVGVDPLPIVEDWGTLDDGQGIDKILAAGTSGYLCAPKTRIVLIRADQTKNYVDSIISQGIHNRRIELYRWFTGMTSAPVLIDTLFCQDRIELSESSMLFSFDAVGALASENPYMTDRANGNKNWPYLIGKAEGVPLELLEDESSKWTVLLGDQDGNEIDEEYTGLIRVDDATRLNPGQHLINGEEVILAKAGAGYMEIAARARSGTEAQEHSNGSRIFPLGAIFKYAVCAGPIGSFEKLRTSNEIDIYDEDEDLDTTEYRDLYNGGNEEYHPELNPAQIWFRDRMPWLIKNQEREVEKIYYGKQYLSSNKYCLFPDHVNKNEGKTEIRIPFTSIFNGGTGAWQSIDTAAHAPSMPGDNDSVIIGDNYKNGKFTIRQNHGNASAGEIYREVNITQLAEAGDIASTTVALKPPEGTEFYWYGRLLLAIPYISVITSYMSLYVQFLAIDEDGFKTPVRVDWAIGEDAPIQSHPAFLEQVYYEELNPKFTHPSFGRNSRLQMNVCCWDVGGSPGDRYARIRIGGQVAYPDGNRAYPHCIAFWAYNHAMPVGWIESTFGHDLSTHDELIDCTVKVRIVVTNTEDAGQGFITITQDGDEVVNIEIPNNDSDIEHEFSLGITDWEALKNTKIRVALNLDNTEKFSKNGEVSIKLPEGIQWLLTYNTTSLDGAQVRYSDRLYTDAVSSRGADWTPAEAFRWLSEDKTSWATDMLDISAIDARRAEYETAGHYLNGLLKPEGYQSAIKEIARQGFFLPFQDGGKVSIQSYLSWPATVSITGDNDSLLEKSKTFEMTDTNSVIQRLVIDYKKNFSTGLFDGQYELNTGEHVEQMNTISLDLVSSESAVILLANWLFSLKSIQLKCLGFDGNFRLIETQSWDKIELPDFLAGDLQAELIVTGVQQQFAQPKNDKPTKFTIKTIKV